MKNILRSMSFIPRLRQSSWTDVYLASGARAVSSCGDFLAATALVLELQQRLPALRGLEPDGIAVLDEQRAERRVALDQADEGAVQRADVDGMGFAAVGGRAAWDAAGLTPAAR